MKRSVLLMISALCLVFLFTPQTQAGVVAGVSIDKGQVQSFYLGIGDYFGFREKEVVAVRERNIPDEELPVVFYLAKKCHVPPRVIIELRLAGRSWWEITTKYHFGADIYYVPMREVSGPPYGRAYGHFRKARHEWKSIVLNDDEIVNLVNLKFISEHYNCPANEIIQRRSGGKSFVVINDDARKMTPTKEKADKRSKAEKETKRHGKGNESR